MTSGPGHKHRWSLWVSAIALNCLLFLPFFVFRRVEADFLPFFPREHPGGAFGFDLRSLLEYPKALLLRRPNPDVFRVSVEMVALVSALLLSARTRARRGVWIAAVALYTSTAVFVTYQAAFRSFFVRAPAVVEDARMLINLFHFLSEMRSAGWILGTLGVVLGLGALIWVVGQVFAGLQAWAAQTQRRLGAPIAVALVLCAGFLVWFGPGRDDPEVQALSKYFVANYRASRAALDREQASREGAPDLRYDQFAELKLQKKPNVYLLMVEAYGEILATWDMTPAYRALMARVEQRLAAKGLHAATFYSAAPVHGGTSWFSISTVHTGMLIDRPQPFATLMERRQHIPTLTRFFKGQGYRTYSLQPGSTDRPGLDPRDWLDHDELVMANDLDYQGRRFGFGGIPDQYALSVFRQKHFALAPSPRFLFYMSVSTHFPWGQYVPPYFKDPLALNQGVEVTSDNDETWPVLAEKASVTDAHRRGYLQSVEYEFRLLTEFLEADDSKELVVVIIGDHQPRLESNPPGEVTMNTPVHVISFDAAFVEAFVRLGAQPGMFAEPGRVQAMLHEGLFSLLVSRLASRYGDAPSALRATWSPEGAELSGLRRE